MSQRRRSSPAAEPLEDDDLLSEILLRLPPDPSSLPRASAVCRRWRGLASDLRFSRRFRAHHRRSPPLIACFVQEYHRAIHFEPAMEAPNRVPRDRFSVPIVNSRRRSRFLGCRHGLLLVFRAPRMQILVCDPVVGDRRRLDIPPAMFPDINSMTAAVFRPAGDARHFQVVLVGYSDMQDTQVVASVYSSETSRWGDLVSMQLLDDSVYTTPPAMMLGNSFYWRLAGNGILEFDLDTQSLALIPIPEEIVGRWPGVGKVWVLPTEDGGLGFLFVSGFSAQLWKRKTDCDGVASWVLGRTIALDTLLSVNSGKEPYIVGFAEENNAVLLWTSIGVFSVQLESLEFKKLFEHPGCFICCPFECVYVADNGIDGERGEAKLLQNT